MRNKAAMDMRMHRDSKLRYRAGAGHEMERRSLDVAHVITGLGDGGAEAVLYRLCSRDDQNRHRVISLMDEGKYGSLLRAAGVDVYCLDMPRGRIRLRSMLRLWRLLRQLRPDVVQTWMYHGDLLGGVVARMAGVRIVHWGLHNTTLEKGVSPGSTVAVARINSWLSHWVPTSIVCCAEQAFRVHVDLGFSAGKLVVIPNGYDLNHFQPDLPARSKVRAMLGVAESTALIGMVGRFDPEKDHENLLRALAQIDRHEHEFKCVLIGTGMDGGNIMLSDWLGSYGLLDKVMLLGQRNDVPEVMSALDLHVLSSRSEAFPNVLAEAMACGTPCITTDVGDAALIVGETGWVVPPRNPKALADAMRDALKCLQDHDAWAERQHRARMRIVDNYDLDRMVDRYRKVWAI